MPWYPLRSCSDRRRSFQLQKYAIRSDHAQYLGLITLDRLRLCFDRATQTREETHRIAV